MMSPFTYEEAFSRNIGWITRTEQAQLKCKRVAIAGLGGAGGSHLITLTRLGIGAFSLAEFDNFEVANFNRQSGATLSSLGRSKLKVMVETAKQINPDLDIREFPHGLTAQNVREFLADVDLYVDGLDFFAMSAREVVFRHLDQANIPGITAGPLGMSAAVLSFLPGGMSFEEYFLLSGQPEEEKRVRFLVGLSPMLLHRTYIVDHNTLDFSNRKAPSTPMGVALASGLAGCEALKILLRRGRVLAAPHAQHFDGYRNRFVRTWRPGGNRNPLQRLTLAFARRKLGLSRPC